MLSLAAIVYGLFASGAVLWCWLADRLPWPIYDPTVSDPTHLMLGLGAGLGLGVAVVVASRAMVARLAWARTLYGWFRQALGPLSDVQVLALALLSSVGEELFFRGAMQPAWGVLPATLVFAVLHFPSRPVLWPWTVMAGLMGLAFGWITLWTGSVAGATVSHFVINLLNLLHIVRFPALEEKLPAPDPAPSMVDHADPHSVDGGDGAGPDRDGVV